MTRITTPPPPPPPPIRGQWTNVTTTLQLRFQRHHRTRRLRSSSSCRDTFLRLNPFPYIHSWISCLLVSYTLLEMTFRSIHTTCDCMSSRNGISCTVYILRRSTEIFLRDKNFFFITPSIKETHTHTHEQTHTKIHI